MPEQTLHQGCSYAALICRAIQRWPDHTALIDDDGEVTYRAPGERVSQYCQVLADLGLTHGDGLALLSHNWIDAVAVQYATLMAGIRYTPLHPMGSIDDHVFIVTPHHLSLRPPPYQAGPQRHDQAKRDRYSKWVRERKTFLAGRMHHDHHALYAIFEEACLLFMEFSV